MNISPNENYICSYPFAYGKLNTHSGVNGSITAVATSIERLWGKAIETFLDIPVKDFQFYRAVLIIPDIFDRDHMKLLIDIVLNRLKFSCIIVAQVLILRTESLVRISFSLYRRKNVTGISYNLKHIILLADLVKCGCS